MKIPKTRITGNLEENLSEPTKEDMIHKTGKLFNILDYLEFSDTYVETGTAMGESLRRALLAGYKNLYSVDIHLPFVTAMRLKYTTAEIHLGKSYDMLPIMLERADCNSVIFLDAHPAGPNTGGHNELMLGDSSYGQDYIIAKELAVIGLQMLMTGKRHIIIIDDQDINSALNFAMVVNLCVPNQEWKFSIWNEQLEDGILYKDKILVCEPC